MWHRSFVAMGAALRLNRFPERAYLSMADLIATLGDDPSGAATETLEALSKVPDAEPWVARDRAGNGESGEEAPGA